MIILSEFKDNTLPLTKENILNFVSPLTLFQFYSKITNFNKPVRCFFHKEKNSSLLITPERDVFKCFGCSKYGDCFDFIGSLYNLDFYKVLQLINKDFNLNLGSYSKKNGKTLIPIVKREYKKEEKKVSTIQVITKKATITDIKYWESFGITKSTLSKYNIYPVSKVFVNKNLRGVYSLDNPIYCYHFPKTDRVKVYFPFNSKTERFLGNATNLKELQGLDQLPEEGKLCVFTKSMKDVGTLHELGYNSVATHGESSFIPISVIDSIFTKFKEGKSLYDKELSGIIGSRRLWRDHSIKPYFIGKKYQVKDISDFVKRYSLKEADKYLKELFQVN